MNKFLTIRAIPVFILSLALAVVPSTVATSTTQWTTPVNIATNGTYNQSMKMASTPTSTVAAWDGDDNGTTSTFVSRSTDQGVSWTTPVRISQAGSTAFGVKVFSAGSNKYIAQWLTGTSQNFSLVNSTSNDDGITWSVPATISTGLSQVSGIVRVADRHLSFWINGTSPSTVSFAASTDSGSSWGSATNVVGPTGSNTLYVMACENNELIIVWHESGSIKSQRSDNYGSTWTMSQTISASGYPQKMISNGVGGLALVWRDNASPNTIQVSQSGCLHSETWGASIRVSPLTFDAMFPDIVANADGELTVAWAEDTPNSGNDKVFVSTSTSSGTLWSPPQLMSNPAHSSLYPELSANSQGTSVLTWYEGASPDQLAYSISSDNGKTWETANIFPAAGGGGTYVPMEVTPQQSFIALINYYPQGQSLKTLDATSLLFSQSSHDVSPLELARTGFKGLEIWTYVTSGLLLGGITLMRLRKLHYLKD